MSYKNKMYDLKKVPEDMYYHPLKEQKLPSKFNAKRGEALWYMSQKPLIFQAPKDFYDKLIAEIKIFKKKEKYETLLKEEIKKQ